MDNSTPGMEELLVQYLDGELAPGEKESLEAKLAADPALQEQLGALQAAREAIRLYGLQQKVSRIHTGMMEELQPRIKNAGNTRRFLRYAAAIAAGVLLVVGGFLAYSFFTLSPEKVFSANYTPYTLSSTRAGDSAVLSVIEEAYRQKNYSEVINTMYNRPFTLRENLLRGMASMELGQDSSALILFKSVMNDPAATSGNLLKQDAEYYGALSAIRLKQYDEAFTLLRSIQDDPSHLYHEKVTAKLLRQLRMLKRR